MVEHRGPLYLRIGRIDDAPCIFEEKESFEIGRIKRIYDGTGTVILSTGIMTSHCMKAVEMLKHDGLQPPGLFHVSTLKPINEHAIIDILAGNPLVFTVENHSITGGLGSIVREVAMKNNLKNRIMSIGIKNLFGTCGKPEALQSYFGISHEDIYERVGAAMTSGSWE
jgi:transketolase